MNTKGPEPSKSSDVVVSYYTTDPAFIPGLAKQARDASRAEGYSPNGIRYSSQVPISLSIDQKYDESGFYLHFLAPAAV
jgi:hypothetical protein